MSDLIEFFDNLAKTYDNKKFVTSRDVSKEVECLSKYFSLDKSSRVLDVGCGTGRLSYEFYRKGYNIHAIDISPEMIKISKEKYPEMEKNFECIDFQDLDNVYYDRVFSIMGGAFGLITKNNNPSVVIDRFLSKLNVLLNSSGIAIIEFLNIVPVLKEVNSKNIDNKEFILGDSLVQYSQKIYEKGFTPSEIKYICEKSGFNIIGIYSINENENKLEDISLDSHIGIAILTK